MIRQANLPSILSALAVIGHNDSTAAREIALAVEELEALRKRDRATVEVMNDPRDDDPWARLASVAKALGLSDRYGPGRASNGTPHPEALALLKEARRRIRLIEIKNEHAYALGLAIATLYEMRDELRRQETKGRGSDGPGAIRSESGDYDRGYTDGATEVADRLRGGDKATTKDTSWNEAIDAAVRFLRAEAANAKFTQPAEVAEALEYRAGFIERGDLDSWRIRSAPTSSPETTSGVGDYDHDNPERPVPGLSADREVCRLSDVVVIRNCEITMLQIALGSILDRLVLKGSAYVVVGGISPKIIARAREALGRESPKTSGNTSSPLSPVSAGAEAVPHHDGNVQRPDGTPSGQGRSCSETDSGPVPSAAEPDEPAADPSRCTVCGSSRILLDRKPGKSGYGACSLVPKNDSRGCPDPLRDYDREQTALRASSGGESIAASAAHQEEDSMRATGEKPDLVGRASGMAGSRPDEDITPHLHVPSPRSHDATGVADAGARVPATSGDGAIRSRVSGATSPGGAEMQGDDPGAGSPSATAKRGHPDCPLCEGEGTTPYSQKPCDLCDDIAVVVARVRTRTIEACARLCTDNEFRSSAVLLRTSPLLHSDGGSGA